MSMSAAEHLLLSRNEPRIVLRASVSASANKLYAVTFMPGELSQLSEHDYLRFALHYYARVLHQLSRSHAIRDLPRLIENVAASTAAWNVDVFALAGVRATLVPAVSDPIGRVNVALRSLGARDFDVDGEIGLTGRALSLSVFAVLQAVIARVSAEVAYAVRAAMANMNASYAMTHRYSDPNSCREVPAIAYLAAAFV